MKRAIGDIALIILGGVIVSVAVNLATAIGVVLVAVGVQRLEVEV